MKPKTTLKLMMAQSLANSYGSIGQIDTIERRAEVYRLLDGMGYYWSSAKMAWVRRVKRQPTTSR